MRHYNQLSHATFAQSRAKKRDPGKLNGPTHAHRDTKKGSLMMRYPREAEPSTTKNNKNNSNKNGNKKVEGISVWISG